MTFVCFLVSVLAWLPLRASYRMPQRLLSDSTSIAVFS